MPGEIPFGVLIRADVEEFTGGIGKVLRSLAMFEDAVSDTNKAMAIGVSTSAAFAGVSAAAFSATALATGYAIKSAADLQEQMLNVQKTTNETDSAIEALRLDFIGLSKEMPIVAEELGKIAAAGGQLGITGRTNLREFTKTVAQIGSVTDLSTERAAISMARLSALFNLPINQSEKLGSAMNELSNRTTATVANLDEVTRRFGGTAYAMGITSDQALALSATLIDMGVTQEIAGTNLINLSTRMARALPTFAQFTDMSREAFEELWTRDKLSAIQAFTSSFRGKPFEEVAQALGDVGINGGRLTQVVLALANGQDRLNRNLQVSNEAFAKGISLREEFERITSGLNAQLKILWNRFQALVKVIGATFIPVLTLVVKALGFVLDILSWIPGPFWMTLFLFTLIATAAMAFFSTVVLVGIGLVMLIRKMDLVNGAMVLMGIRWKNMTMGMSKAWAGFVKDFNFQRTMAKFRTTLWAFNVDLKKGGLLYALQNLGPRLKNVKNQFLSIKGLGDTISKNLAKGVNTLAGEALISGEQTKAFSALVTTGLAAVGRTIVSVGKLFLKFAFWTLLIYYAVDAVMWLINTLKDMLSYAFADAWEYFTRDIKNFVGALKELAQSAMKIIYVVLLPIVTALWLIKNVLTIVIALLTVGGQIMERALQPMLDAWQEFGKILAEMERQSGDFFFNLGQFIREFAVVFWEGFMLPLRIASLVLASLINSISWVIEKLSGLFGDTSKEAKGATGELHGFVMVLRYIIKPIAAVVGAIGGLVFWIGAVIILVKTLIFLLNTALVSTLWKVTKLLAIVTFWVTAIAWELVLLAATILADVIPVFIAWAGQFLYIIGLTATLETTLWGIVAAIWAAVGPFLLVVYGVYKLLNLMGIVPGVSFMGVGLASGGIVQGGNPTPLSIVGEGKSSEAVIPLNPRGLAPIAEAAAIGSQKSNGPATQAGAVPSVTIPITVELDGRTLFRVVKEYSDREILAALGSPALGMRGVS